MNTLKHGNTRQRFGTLAAGGGLSPLPAALDQMSGGQGPQFLSPKDWTSGRIKNELTGDMKTDAQSSLAKYGLFAAPWMPAMLYESSKKRDKVIAGEEQAARQAQIMAGYNRFSPYQRNVQVYGQGSQYPGYYNDLADTLAGGAMRGLL